MAFRRRLECALLEPESIADILRRLGHVFFARTALRLISLVTNGTAFGRSIFWLFLQRHRHEPTARISSGLGRVKSHDVDVFVVREANTEFRNELPSLFQRIVNVAETGKQPAAGVFGAVLDVTV